MIDYDSPIPLYRQIMDELLEQIQTGELAVGSMIPSELQITNNYRVSRNTAQKAIQELVHKGILTRKKGLGTFVASPKLEQELGGFYSFSKALKLQGIETCVKVISLKKGKAFELCAKLLEINEKQEVYILKRVRYANKAPIMIEESHIPAQLTPDLETIDFEKNSLYSVLDTIYNINVYRAKEIFEPVNICKEDSVLLDVEEKSPAIMLDRIAFSSDEKPVEFCRSIVAGDKCRFYTELR